MAYNLWKFLASLIFAILSHITVSFSVIVANDRLPDRKKHPPLPDVLLDNVTYVPWGNQASEICLLILILMWCTLLGIHKQRMIIMQRTFILVGTLFYLRCLCILVTSVPVPDVNKTCHVFPNSSLGSKLLRALQFYSSMGMKVWGSKTCGDYIFSGHTVMMTLMNLFVNEYTPKSSKVLHFFAWILNFAGMIFILLCRGHYTIDVILAFYITLQLFIFYHSLLAHKSSIGKMDKRLMWMCFPIFNWLETNNEESFRSEFEFEILGVKKPKEDTEP